MSNGNGKYPRKIAEGMQKFTVWVYDNEEEAMDAYMRGRPYTRMSADVDDDEIFYVSFEEPYFPKAT